MSTVGSLKHWFLVRDQARLAKDHQGVIRKMLNTIGKPFDSVTFTIQIAKGL
ncbi:hypothetical protein D3C85_1592320 [compost metagenome]